MNGRIYDPTLGRFLQADPFIQAPKNSQSYNRYSYVLNNPLRYTDPSGYLFSGLKKRFRKNIRSAVKVFGEDVVNIAGMTASSFCYAWAPACAGAWTYEFNRAMGNSSSGSLKSAGTAAATVYASQQIGGYFNKTSANNIADAHELAAFAEGSGTMSYSASYNTSMNSLTSFGGNMLSSSQIAGQIASHALVGGIAADVNGGKFGHGFFSAGVTKGAGGAYLPGGSNLSSGEIVYGTVVSYIIGGTASEISGGKFANGARTTAFQYLFNAAKGQMGRKNNFRKPNPYAPEFSDFLELLGESAQENLSLKFGLEAAYGPGLTAQGARTLRGDYSYEFAYTKGVMFNPLGSFGGEVYSSGEIVGGFQSFDICAVGCVNIEWNYTDWSISTSLAPAFGITTSGGYKGKL